MKIVIYGSFIKDDMTIKIDPNDPQKQGRIKKIFRTDDGRVLTAQDPPPKPGEEIIIEMHPENKEEYSEPSWGAES